MATQKGSTHSVGNLNSREVLTVPEVKAGANLENYTLVELGYVDGERIAQPLSDPANESFLACAVEVLYDNEMMKEFYIGQGEYLRVVHVRKGLRFETSAFTQISGTAPAKGQFASFDVAEKKFQLEVAENATAKHTFRVVEVLDGEYGFGLKAVGLEAIK